MVWTEVPAGTESNLLMVNHACAIAALIPPLPPIDDCSCFGVVGRARMYGRVPPRPLWVRVRHAYFKIGQHLFPARSVGLNVSDGAYVIVKRLPERDGEFEFQIKNLAEPDELLCARVS
jgi:hypothetical protein